MMKVCCGTAAIAAIAVASISMPRSHGFLSTRVNHSSSRLSLVRRISSTTTSDLPSNATTPTEEETITSLLQTVKLLEAEAEYLEEQARALEEAAAFFAKLDEMREQEQEIVKMQQQQEQVTIATKPGMEKESINGYATSKDSKATTKKEATIPGQVLTMEGKVVKGRTPDSGNANPTIQNRGKRRMSLRERLNQMDAPIRRSHS